jgi:hypothetical protein
MIKLVTHLRINAIFIFFFAKLRFINQGDVKYSKSRFFSQVLEFQNFEIFISFS